MRLNNRNIFQTNGINKGKNFFGKNYLDSNNYNINLDLALKSINDSNILFTNFLKSKKCVEYDFIKSFYYSNQRKEIDLDKEFNINDTTYENPNKAKKIKSIIEQTSGTTITQIPVLIKCKHVYNPAFQLFLEWTSPSEATARIIDIHHMVFPTPNKERGEKKANPVQNYVEKQHYDTCLSEIKIKDRSQLVSN